MRTLTILLIFLLAGFQSKAQNPREIVASSHEAIKLSSFEALSTLTITDSKGNQRIRQNTMASKTFPDKTEKRIIKFISPAEVKGTGILIYDYADKKDDMWIYLPALKKTRRIVSSEKSKSFMGSEFTNADMTAPGLDDFTYEIQGEEELNGVNCWKIAAIPESVELEDEYGYGKSISWIAKSNKLVYKTEFYNFDGELIKVIETINFKLLEETSGKYMITEMVANNLQNGRSSKIVMDEIQIAETNNSYFSVAYLER